MGPQWLLTGAGLAHAYRRRARRCLWKGARAYDRLPAVWASVGRMRAGVVRCRADRRSPHAGCCGGAGCAGKPRFDRRHLSARRAQRRGRDLGGCVGIDDRGRSGVGRLSDRHFRLAVGFLDQSALICPRRRHAGGLRAAGPPRVAYVRHYRRCDPRVRARGPGLGARSDRARRAHGGKRHGLHVG